jgi:hypothetical protein
MTPFTRRDGRQTGSPSDYGDIHNAIDQQERAIRHPPRLRCPGAIGSLGPPVSTGAAEETQTDAEYLKLRRNRLDCAAALHEGTPGVPILQATAFADEIRVNALVAAGISEVVHRPLVSAELASVLTPRSTVSRFPSANYDRNTFLPY